MKSSSEKNWVEILTSAITQMVGEREKFKVIVKEDSQKMRFEVKTESKRVLVAWSELMFMLESFGEDDTIEIDKDS